jgi:hypothetical protein
MELLKHRPLGLFGREPKIVAEYVDLRGITDFDMARTGGVDTATWAAMNDYTYDALSYLTRAPDDSDATNRIYREISPHGARAKTLKCYNPKLLAQAGDITFRNFDDRGHWQETGLPKPGCYN